MCLVEPLASRFEMESGDGSELCSPYGIAGGFCCIILLQQNLFLAFLAQLVLSQAAQKQSDLDNHQKDVARVL